MKLTSSVIICTRNRLYDLLRLFGSIQKQILQPDELIIIDSNDEPLCDKQEFKQIFDAKYFPASTLIYKHTKPGLTHQRNVGIDQASADIVYFFDDDVVLTPDYLAQMQAIFLNKQTYAGGMGTVINHGSKGSWRYRLFRTFFLLPRDYASGNFTLSGMPTHAYGTTTFKMVEVLGGCCMAYRLAALKKQRFDERLHGYAYMEDCDISRRIAYDQPLFFNPAAKLYHHNSPINRDAVVKNRAMFVRNYSYLFFKNVYPRNKVKMAAYCWSVFGLFIEGIMVCDMLSLKGYIQGLSSFISEKKTRRDT